MKKTLVTKLVMLFIFLGQNAWALHPSVYESVRRCARVAANTPVIDQGHTEYSRFNHVFVVGNNDLSCLYIDSGSLKEGEEGIHCTKLSTGRSRFCPFQDPPSNFGEAERAQYRTNYLSFMCGIGSYRFEHPLFCQD